MYMVHEELEPELQLTMVCDAMHLACGTQACMVCRGYRSDHSTRLGCYICSQSSSLRVRMLAQAPPNAGQERFGRILPT